MTARCVQEFSADSASRDVLIAQTAICGPLTSFRFNAYAAAGERWHLTVDTVRVYRSAAFVLPIELHSGHPGVVAAAREVVYREPPRALSGARRRLPM